MRNVLRSVELISTADLELEHNTNKICAITRCIPRLLENCNKTKIMRRCIICIILLAVYTSRVRYDYDNQLFSLFRVKYALHARPCSVCFTTNACSTGPILILILEHLSASSKRAVQRSKSAFGKNQFRVVSVYVRVINILQTYNCRT